MSNELVKSKQYNQPKDMGGNNKVYRPTGTPSKPGDKKDLPAVDNTTMAQAHEIAKARGSGEGSAQYLYKRLQLEQSIGNAQAATGQGNKKLDNHFKNLARVFTTGTYNAMYGLQDGSEVPVKFEKKQPHKMEKNDIVCTNDNVVGVLQSSQIRGSDTLLVFQDRSFMAPSFSYDFSVMMDAESPVASSSAQGPEMFKEQVEDKIEYENAVREQAKKKGMKDVTQVQGRVELQDEYDGEKGPKITNNSQVYSRGTQGPPLGTPAKRTGASTRTGAGSNWKSGLNDRAAAGNQVTGKNTKPGQTAGAIPDKHAHNSLKFTLGAPAGTTPGEHLKGALKNYANKNKLSPGTMMRVEHKGQTYHGEVKEGGLIKDMKAAGKRPGASGAYYKQSFKDTNTISNTYENKGHSLHGAQIHTLHKDNTDKTKNVNTKNATFANKEQAGKEYTTSKETSKFKPNMMPPSESKAPATSGAKAEFWAHQKADVQKSHDTVDTLRAKKNLSGNEQSEMKRHLGRIDNYNTFKAEHGAKQSPSGKDVTHVDVKSKTPSLMKRVEGRGGTGQEIPTGTHEKKFDAMEGVHKSGSGVGPRIERSGSKKQTARQSNAAGKESTQRGFDVIKDFHTIHKSGGTVGASMHDKTKTSEGMEFKGHSGEVYNTVQEAKKYATKHGHDVSKINFDIGGNLSGRVKKGDKTDAYSKKISGGVDGKRQYTDKEKKTHMGAKSFSSPTKNQKVGSVDPTRTDSGPSEEHEWKQTKTSHGFSSKYAGSQGSPKSRGTGAGASLHGLKNFGHATAEDYVNHNTPLGGSNENTDQKLARHSGQEISATKQKMAKKNKSVKTDKQIAEDKSKTSATKEMVNKVDFRDKSTNLVMTSQNNKGKIPEQVKSANGYTWVPKGSEKDPNFKKPTTVPSNSKAGTFPSNAGKDFKKAQNGVKRNKLYK